MKQKIVFVTYAVFMDTENEGSKGFKGSLYSQPRSFFLKWEKKDVGLSDFTRRIAQAFFKHNQNDHIFGCDCCYLFIQCTGNLHPTELDDLREGLTDTLKGVNLVDRKVH